MNHRQLARPARILAAATIATITVLAAGSPALAAKGGGGPKPPKSATATASASVAGSDVTLIAKVNRPLSAIEWVSCDLGGSAVDCTPTGANKKNTTYGATVTGLEDGDYTFSVTFNLLDATYAQALASFTVDNVEEPPPPVGAEAACASLSGTFTSSFFSWSCAYVTADPLDGPDPSLIAACASDSEYSLTNNGDGTYVKELDCTRAEILAAQSACETNGGVWSTPSILSGSDDSWDCAILQELTVGETLATLCGQAGGVITAYVTASRSGYYCA